MVTLHDQELLEEKTQDESFEKGTLLDILVRGRVNFGSQLGKRPDLRPFAFHNDEEV